METRLLAKLAAVKSVYSAVPVMKFMNQLHLVGQDLELLMKVKMKSQLPTTAVSNSVSYLLQTERR